MPSGPYPTAFGEPDPSTTSSRYEPIRPASPAPSYHTLPPYTPPEPATATTPPSSTLPSTAPLLAAARATPDAVLSHLTIVNRVGHPQVNRSASSRLLTAITADGKARYRVEGSAPGDMEVAVLKVLGPNEETEEIARVGLTSRGVKIVEWVMEGGQRVKRGSLEVPYGELEGGKGMDVGMRVEGRERGVRWEVVRKEPGADDLEEERGRETSRRKSSEKKRLGGRFASDEHERRRQKEAFVALRLVDREGDVYAEYRHEVGLPSPNQEERWGQVSVRARAVLLDEGIDRAFITLVALLETYVKMFGLSKREHREWGNLAGSMGCCVM